MTDIKLSKRMQTVVGMVKEKTVADIGCDHAFVSIYLMKTGMCSRVIAMDVKKGPIDIAKGNVSSYGMEDRISVRLSDGFSSLKEGEAECAIIAGMGGNLMVNILKAGRVHTDSGIKLVLQPQSDIECVRAYLTDIGYTIEEEDMLVEEGKYYTVMRAIPDISAKEEAPYNSYELAFGPCLLKNRHRVLYQYLEKQLTKNDSIIEGLAKVDTDSSRQRMDELSRENNFIKEIIKLYYA